MRSKQLQIRCERKINKSVDLIVDGTLCVVDSALKVLNLPPDILNLPLIVLNIGIAMSGCERDSASAKDSVGEQG